MNFYELPNIRYLTDEEFDSIFDSFKIASVTERDFWIDVWYNAENPDSVVTCRPPKSPDGGVQYRQFRTNTYTPITTEAMILESMYNGSLSPCYYREIGTRSYLYKVIDSSEIIREDLPDDAPNGPRQLTEEQLGRILEFCKMIDSICQL